MKVNKVTLDGKPVEYRHENNALFIKLPAPSKGNQREKFTVFYQGMRNGGQRHTSKRLR
jgi:hypothetical protein